MLFNSLSFVGFFLIVLAVHYSPLPWRAKKFNLLIASYLFYAAWNPPFVILLWISTLVDWFVAIGISRTERAGRRKALLCLSLFTNLGMLGYFKYATFVLDNFTAGANALGFSYSPPEYSIILPVGISFYTFQTLSYTLDVYRGNLKRCHSLLDFALFVTFFPQLVAGPIVRAADFLPQCIDPRRATGRQFGWGLSLIVVGLFEKAVLADAFLAPIVENVYDHIAGVAPGVLDAWTGTLAFAGQIFCDFAGYSTCAIGVAMCLGFALPDNFRYPYAAIGFSDFWRRWHISLSTWLRDYLYISLGGNRVGPARTYINLMLTMLIGGLWHGAAWNFVIWGGLHGLYLIVERLLTRSRIAGLSVWNTVVGKTLLVGLTFLAVNIAWVFFRAKTFTQAFAIFAAMCGMEQTSSREAIGGGTLLGIWVIVAGILAVHQFLRNKSLEQAVGRLPSWLWAVMLAVMLTLIIMTPGEDRAFIYFQF